MSMVYNSISEIQAVHVEISSACNAGCIDCSRFTYDSSSDSYVINPHHPNLNYLYPTNDFLKHINQFSSLSNLLYCGNSGDPMAHKDLGYITKEIVKSLLLSGTKVALLSRSYQSLKEVSKEFKSLTLCTRMSLTPVG